MLCLRRRPSLQTGWWSIKVSSMRACVQLDFGTRAGEAAFCEPSTATPSAGRVVLSTTVPVVPVRCQWHASGSTACCALAALRRSSARDARANHRVQRRPCDGVRREKHGWSTAGKVALFGLIKRNGRIRAMLISSHDQISIM